MIDFLMIEVFYEISTICFYSILKPNHLCVIIVLKNGRNSRAFHDFEENHVEIPPHIKNILT